MNKKVTLYQVHEYYVATGERKNIKCFRDKHAAEELARNLSKKNRAIYGIREIEFYE